MYIDDCYYTYTTNNHLEQCWPIELLVMVVLWTNILATCDFIRLYNHKSTVLLHHNVDDYCWNVKSNTFIKFLRFSKVSKIQWG